MDTQWQHLAVNVAVGTRWRGLSLALSTSSQIALVVSYVMLQTCAFIIYTFMSSLLIAFVGTYCFANSYRTQVLFHVCQVVVLMHQLQRDLRFDVTFAIFVTR